MLFCIGSCWTTSCLDQKLMLNQQVMAVITHLQPGHGLHVIAEDVAADGCAGALLATKQEQLITNACERVAAACRGHFAVLLQASPHSVWYVPVCEGQIDQIQQVGKCDYCASCSGSLLSP